MNTVVFKKSHTENIDGCLLKKILYAGYFLSLGCFLLRLCGGLVLLSQPAIREKAATPWIPMALCCGSLFFAALLSGLFLFKADRRIFVFHNIHIAALVFASLYGSEVVLRFFVPPWPAIGLHGTKAQAGEHAWGRVVTIHHGMAFNSWGQRDIERTIVPEKGTKRVVFVGDSLLEESSMVPLSVATERKIGLADPELINLGVSATGPSEYYYRIKNIALALQPDRVFMFFYDGNDFTARETLKSYWGIVACYPKDSLFSKMGLLALNHVLTNNKRPVLNAWGAAGRLNEAEQGMHRRFSRATDREAIQILASMGGQENREKVINYLEGRSLTDFFQGLRLPDYGLFRSHYIYAAVQFVIHDRKPDRIPDVEAYQWVLKSYEECRKRKVNFTLVIVPDAFEVDTRMIALWKPFVDMGALRGRPLRKGADELMARCRQDGMDCVDLYQFLKGSGKTYLNPDGHFSEKGVNISSAALAAHIEELVRQKRL